MKQAVSPGAPSKLGWAKALTSSGDQWITDSYKSGIQSIILMSAMDWIVSHALELDPRIERFKYLRDAYRPRKRKDAPVPRWQFWVKPRAGDQYLLEVLERNRRRSDKSTSRRHRQCFIDDLPEPEIGVSNMGAVAYLASTWFHSTAHEESAILRISADGQVRTLKQMFEQVRGNHAVFVSAVLRLHILGSISTNLDNRPLGWLTHISVNVGRRT